MNQLDLLILLPLAFFCYRGFVNGFLQEVLSIAGTILAIFLTFQYMDTVGTFIQPLFEEESTLVPFVAAVIIFLATIILANVLALLGKKFLQAIHLNFINRLTGMAFGLVKTGIIISALLIILSGFNIPSEESKQDSILYSYIIPLAPWAYDAVASVYPGAKDFSEVFSKYQSPEQQPI